VGLHKAVLARVDPGDREVAGRHMAGIHLAGEEVREGEAWERLLVAQLADRAVLHLGKGTAVGWHLTCLSPVSPMWCGSCDQFCNGRTTSATISSSLYQSSGSPTGTGMNFDAPTSINR
jgi:hypothetical protein